MIEVADVAVVVLRGCYLALRRAVHGPVLASTTAAVLLEEAGRTLSARDVAQVFDLPVLARVPVKSIIARAVDAGVLATRLPESLARSANDLLRRLDPSLGSERRRRVTLVVDSGPGGRRREHRAQAARPPAARRRSPRRGRIARRRDGPPVAWASCCATSSPLLSSAQFDELLDQLTHEVAGLGPLEPLLADPTVTEVMINGPGHAYVERRGRLEPVGLGLDARAIVHLVERVVAPLGLRLDRSSPMVDARLPDGSRLHAVIPPLAIDGPCVTIRRFGAHALALDDFGVVGRRGRRSCAPPSTPDGTSSWRGPPARARRRC